MKKILIILLLLTYDSFSQSLSVFDIDTSAFPTIKAKFYDIDANGNQIVNLSPADFLIYEKGEPRDILSISCPDVKQSENLSLVVAMEMTCSMKYKGAEYAYAVAEECVNFLPGVKSECAITSFGIYNYLNQDFTTDKQKLLNSIVCKEPNGVTNFDVAFISPKAGALIIAEHAKYKRVIILVTDGSGDGNEPAIISKANLLNAEIYCIVLTVECPQVLKNISEKTGGECFDKIMSREQALAAVTKIIMHSQGQSPCHIEWKSQVLCESKVINLNIEDINSRAKFTTNLQMPKTAMANLLIQPSGIHFENQPLNQTADTTIVITAVNADFNITDIISSNTDYNITPSGFYLQEGGSKTLTLSFTPKDSNYSFSNFNVVTDVCNSYYYANSSYTNKPIMNPSLKLVQPNGGEFFIVGSDTIITWEGVLPEDTVMLEYSNDGGNQYCMITNKASGFRYVWKNIPPPVSDRCLIRVTQFGKNMIVPQIQWSKSFGGRLWEYPHDIQPTIDGGYIMTGFSSSSNGDLTDNKGNSDVWVVKLDTTGKIQWQKSFGGTEFDAGYSIQQTKDGGYIVGAGTKSVDGDITDNQWNDEDYWVVKLNANGNLEWQKKIGGRWQDRLGSVTEVDDGGYLATGYIRDSGVDVTEFKGDYDTWIAKLDAFGNLVWQKTIGGSNRDILREIRKTKDGSFIATGFTGSTDGDLIDRIVSIPSDDFWVVKLNNNGNIIWQKTYGGTSAEDAWDIKQTADFGFIATGTTRSNDGDVTGYHGDYDYWVVKTDSDGNLQWQKTLGGSSDDHAFCVQQTRDYGFVITGYTNSNDGDMSDFKGQFDYWVVKLDVSGNLQWQKNFGGSEWDLGRSILQTQDGGFIVAGNSGSTDGEVIDHIYLVDIWLIKLTPDIDIVQQDISDEMFHIVAPQAESKEIDMGKVQLGSSKDSLVSDFIINTGTWKFRVDSIYIDGSDAQAFSLNSGFPIYQVEAGDSHYAEFSFTPLRIGIHQSKIVIITQSDTLIQNIYGEGVKEDISVFGNIIDFGIREIANYKDTTMVLITNNSSNPVNISSIIMLGPDKEQFEFVNGNVTPLTLNSGESHTMTIRFNPKYIGRTSGQIGFFHNAAGSPSTVQLFGAGIGAQISASFDSAYAGEVIDANIKLESGNLTKFAELIGSFDGVFRVENSILAPINKSDLSKTQNDSAYIKFSGNVNPNNSTLATLKLKAGLGRVEETSIDFENINWYDTEGNFLEYDTEFSSGHFKLLGICREGGTRLVNPNSQAGMMTIAPNPAENKLDISLLLTEKGQTEICIYNVLGEVVQTLFSENVVQYNTRDINTDLSELSTGQYLIILRTPTYIESSRLMIIK